MVDSLVGGAAGALSSDMASSSLIPTGIVAVLIIICLGAYLYFSLSFMAIGKKAKLKSPGVAWLSPIVTMFEASGMHWWPMPVFIITYMLSFLLMTISAILGGIVLFAAGILATVMSIIWQWKMFEAVQKPGWWALSAVVGTVIGAILILASQGSGLLQGLGLLILLAGMVTYLVQIGMAAWS